MMLVGRAIVDAIAKDKLPITADVQSAVLARTIGIVAPVVRACASFRGRRAVTISR
ncbi:MAG: hypothetical protein ABJD24_16550 [Acidimicrobiales bacterium]